MWSQPDSWADTHLRLIKTTFFWTIDGFDSRPEECGQYIQSPTFTATEDMTTKWYLTLYPNGREDINKEWVFIALHMKTSEREVLPTFYKYSLKDSKDCFTTSQRFKKRFESNHNIDSQRFGLKSDILNPNKGLLVDNKLRIYCEIKYSLGKSDNTCGVYQTHTFDVLDSGVQSLVSDLSTLFESGKGSDVVLVSGDQELKAHKAILMARSPVFAAMFEHSIEKKDSERVQMKDIDHKVLKEMLRYIYTSKVENMEELGAELLLAADECHMNDLKTICENSIGADLTVQKVCDLLIIADMQSKKELKSRAIEFIQKHAKDVMKTNGWQRLVNKRQYLLNEFVITLTDTQSHEYQSHRYN